MRLMEVVIKNEYEFVIPTEGGGEGSKVPQSPLRCMNLLIAPPEESWQWSKDQETLLRVMWL